MWQPASERLQVRMWAAYGRWGGRNKRLTAATETRRAGAVCVCVCSPGRNAPLQMFPVRRDASPGCQQTSENDRRALKRAFFCPCLCVVTFCCYVSRYASQWGGWEEEGGAACNNLCLHCIPVQTHRWRAFFLPPPYKVTDTHFAAVFEISTRWPRGQLDPKSTFIERRPPHPPAVVTFFRSCCHIRMLTLCLKASRDLLGCKKKKRRG